MTRIDLGLALLDAATALVGYAVLYAVGLARIRAADLRLAGLAYLLGFAVLGSVLSFALMAGVGPGLPVLAVVAAVAVAAGLAVGRRRGETPLPPRAHTRHPLALLAAAGAGALLAVASLAALALAVEGTGYADYWDSVNFWIPRAEAIYYGLDPSVWGSFVHPEYPPLVPTMDAAAFSAAGGFHPSLLSFQQALLGIAFLLAVIGLLDRFAPRWIVLPPLALLVSTPWFWWRLQAPLADQPLAYLVTAAAVACVIWLRERRTAWLVLAFVLLTAASLTKLEGGLFGLLLVATTLAAGFALERRTALPAAALLLAPAAILPWRLWLGRHDLPSSAEDYDLSDLVDPGFLAGRTHRLTEVLHWLAHTPFSERQTATLIVAAIATLLVVAVQAPGPTSAVAAWLALCCAGFVAVYWIGKLQVDWYLGTSASRVGATIAIAAATLGPLLFGLALGPAPPGTGPSREDAGPSPEA